MKSEKMKKRERPIEHESSSSAAVKPMERKKKRKAMDKEKHHSSSPTAAIASKLKEKVIEPIETSPTSSGNGLPEFHIGVFKDLAAAEASVRAAAAERLVTELMEVQKAYDKLDKKEEFENGLKLEAEKNDGLNNCAPSVAYAVRRLIRGVSSSREGFFHSSAFILYMN